MLFSFNEQTMVEKMEYGWISSLNNCNELIENWLLFSLGFTWNSKYVIFFHAMEIWFDDIKYKICVSFRKIDMIFMMWEKLHP